MVFKDGGEVVSNVNTLRHEVTNSAGISAGLASVLLPSESGTPRELAGNYNSRRPHMNVEWPTMASPSAFEYLASLNKLEEHRNSIGS